ncbi:MAG: hypothetical protein HUJ31_02875, partial [Pseudomonadales bacterium]|nr:hypothetical protein [Pseudomonadales bacterium]
MALGIFEINDAGIQVAVDGEIVTASPGYAVLDGDTLLIGQEGMDNARLLPRWTNNRFWNQLGSEPIPNRTATIRHHADLAFSHLESLWQSIRNDVNQFIFVVPGFYSREQLGLLLGMAQEAEIPATGIVDASLSAVSRQAASIIALHLEIYLHRITLTELSADDRLSRKDTVTVCESGIFTLWDRWANIIANQFIQTSRYDPMHQAVSEQRLYDQLPGWIRGLADNRGNRFELDLPDANHSVSVSTEQLMNACANIYPQVVQAVRARTREGAPIRLFISDRFRGFPGLSDSLQLINNVESVWLEAADPVQGAMDNREHIISSSGAVSHVTSLPVADAAEPATKRTNEDRRLRATHLLLDHRATPIGTAFKLGRNLEDGLSRATRDPICTVYPRGAEVIHDIPDPGAITV